MTWRDDLTSRDGVEACLICSSPTRSHVVLIKHDDATDEFWSTDDFDAADAAAKVCHTCYESVDGEAERLIAEYIGYLRGVCSAADIEIIEVVRNPDAVEAEIDEKLLEGGIR
jgi:hypothetical protein